MGHLCQDIICEMAHFPERGHSNHALKTLISAGGAASQAMVAYSRLGGDAGFAGNIGRDSIGRELIKGLRDEGVDTSFLRPLEGVQSGFSIVLTEKNSGERTFVVHRPAYKSIRFDPLFREYLSSAKCLHIDGTNMQEHLRAAAFAREKGLLVSYDGCSMRQDREKTKKLISLTDILIMNEQFPCWITGANDLRDAMLELAAWGPKVIIATRGEKTVFSLENGSVAEYMTFKVEVTDTTGAGDVFHGAFLFAYLRGRALADCIRFACAVSAISCTGLGGRAGIPDYDGTMAFLSRQQSGQNYR